MRLGKFSALAAMAPLIITAAIAGPISYGICQSGCCALAGTCYLAAGAVFVSLVERYDVQWKLRQRLITVFCVQGTVTAGVGTPPALLACNSALGVCSAKCAAVTLLLPTP